MPDIRVDPFGDSVPGDAGETILGAVLRSGRYLRYGCRHGGCGTCRALLVSGEADDGGSTFALPPAARAAGWILPCRAVPLGDCVIDVSAMGLAEPEFRGGDPVITYTAALSSVTRLTPTVDGVTLRLTDPPSMPFRAGQFVAVQVPGTGAAAARAFSMASSPADGARLELFVRRLPGSLFGRWLAAARPGDTLALRGPLGSLRVRPSYRNLIMIAGGSGLAPVLAMLTDLAERQDPRAAWLFFGARDPGELFHADRIRRLCSVSAGLTFIPVAEHPDAAWAGETGLVTDAVPRLLPALRGFDAYVCGPPPLVAAAARLVIRLGVREPNVYYDAVAPTGD